jgi:TonB family protein
MKPLLGFFLITAVTVPAQAQTPLAECVPNPDSKGFTTNPITSTHTLVNGSNAMARAAGNDGATILDVHLLEDGTVADVAVTQSSGSTQFDEKAATQVKEQWKWAPTISARTCTPIEVHISVKMRIWLGH